MKTLYKINEQGKLISFPKNQCAIIEGKVYTNPSNEILYSLGFRPLGTITEFPEFDVNTQTLKIDYYYYNDGHTEILPKYSVCALEPIINNKTVKERLADLEQASLEQDIALMELAEMLAGGEK